MLSRGSLTNVSMTSQTQEPDGTTAQFLLSLQKGTISAAIAYTADGQLTGIMLKPSVPQSAASGYIKFLVLALVLILAIVFECRRRLKRAAAEAQ